MIIPNIWENKKCSNPPTSLEIMISFDQKPATTKPVGSGHVWTQSCQASGLVVDVPLLIQGQVIDDSNLKRTLGRWALGELRKSTMT